MSLQPQVAYLIPQETARVARAIFQPAISSCASTMTSACSSTTSISPSSFLRKASLAAFRRLGNAHGLHWTLVSYAQELYQRGLYDEAEAYAVESLDHITHLGQRAGVALCQFVLGRLAYAQGDDARAAALLAESLAGHRKTGYRSYSAEVLVWLRRLALAQGDDPAALARLDEGLALFRELGDRDGIALALQQMAQVARHRNQPERATALLMEGMAQVRGLKIGPDDRFLWRLTGLEGLAASASHLGDAMRAARLFGAAQAQRDAVGFVRTPRERVVYEGDVAIGRSQLDEPSWQAAWVEGQAMTLEQAIACALEEAP